MKLRLVIAGLFTFLVTVTASATTLKLAPEIDLLVLDGRKISGSLLKGADGLELERGQHQLLFRIEKNLKAGAHSASRWVSSPLIVTFNAQVQSITITLPVLTTLQQGMTFNQRPEFHLYDEHSKLMESQQDRLVTVSDENFEQAMVAYNMEGKIASVPRFAQPPTPSNSLYFAGHLNEGRTPRDRVLQLWYDQVDSATRQRLAMLLRALHDS
ncbi:YccT family protein [Erwinia psidii]|uniref:DUF2057 domain-containing protein n=1 Tax=Erwinia psidii TaxID=69224 RepID=A0A3N6SA55_9GAMM|nr:DUF2057 family protein [Erwinia psidii]MCX8957432.1 DUF2057 domain-containing protein [Erwinia psidii]MCX8959801.1 DUF2057 domain-containing protein [Erwinia psidii]MCX8964745.1 DUF2057 domain-containing protein [Erwinia psidii]RQM38150.1 DUF2057 domain-containing protein [Erwinia psidii]